MAQDKNVNKKNVNTDKTVNDDIFHQAVVNMQKQAEQQGQEKKFVYDFDELKLYFGEDYKVNDFITIKQPTIGDIIQFGERNVWTSIAPFTSNPTSYRLQLWDMGIDWNKIQDFELFVMLVRGMPIETTKLIFGDIDFSKFNPYKNVETDELVLVYSDNTDFQIDEKLYMVMREYIRLMFNIHPKVEKAKGKVTKQSLIDEDRMHLILEQKKSNNTNKSLLLPMISAMINHPGFKYKKNELRDVGIVEFMDSVKRLQVYEDVRALKSGIYSGFVDTSKMDLQKDLNWLRDISL